MCQRDRSLALWRLLHSIAPLPFGASNSRRRGRSNSQSAAAHRILGGHEGADVRQEHDQRHLLRVAAFAAEVGARHHLRPPHPKPSSAAGDTIRKERCQPWACCVQGILLQCWSPCVACSMWFSGIRKNQPLQRQRFCERTCWFSVAHAPGGLCQGLPEACLDAVCGHGHECVVGDVGVHNLFRQQVPPCAAPHKDEYC